MSGARPAGHTRRLSLVAVALTTALVLSGVALTTAPANAETFTSKINASTSLFDCTQSKTLCTQAVASAAVGTTARMVCWEDGRHLGDATKPRWFYVRLSTGKQGFVKAERVSSQTGVPSCGLAPV